MATEKEDDIELVFPDEGEEESDDPSLEQFVEDSEEPEPEPLTYSDEEPNLVRVFEAHEDGRKALKRIAKKVQSDFEEAQKGTEEYREQLAKDWKLFCGFLENKTFPYENCANAHVPIMLENCSRLVMRMGSELMGDANLFSVVAMGPEDDVTAHLLTIHGNWQLNEQIDDFHRHVDRGLLSFVLAGDVTWHSFYDSVRRENRHEVLSPDQVYVPPTIVSTRVDYSDVPYIIKLLFMYRHELQAMRENWEHVDEVLDREAPSWHDDPDVDDLPMVATAMESSLIDIDTDSTAPYKLLHYEGWLELPDQPRDRYCQVILDSTTGNILKLSVHEEVDWRDRERVDLQTQEYQAYMEARGAYDAQFDQAKEEELQARDALSVAADVPEMARQPLLDQAAGARAMLEPPQRPEWMVDDAMPPEEVRKVPIHMFSHGVCIEGMFGDKGLSFGRIQADFNRAADTAMSQFTDAATLGNCWTFLATEGFEVKGKDGVAFQPGKINYVTGTSGDDIRKVIMELKPEPANPQLLQLVDKVYAYGQSSIQAPAVLSGESGKSGETFRGISARIDQATKQLSTSTKKFSKVLNNVIRNNARLNAAFLPDNELVSMTDTQEGQVVARTIGRAMYNRNYRIKFTSDMKFSSKEQRISEADELVQLPAAVPPLQQNLAFIYETTKRALIARDRSDLVRYLGPPPPVPSTPFGMPPPPPPGMEPPPEEMPPEGMPPEGIPQ